METLLYYLVALAWGFAGWFLRVVWNYWKHSREIEKETHTWFNWDTFRKKYDQDWIMSGVATIVFALISDWAWSIWLSELLLKVSTPYDPKANVIIGFLAILLVEKLSGEK